MIQPQTLLNVADNSGARKLMCIRVIGLLVISDMLNSNAEDGIIIRYDDNAAVIIDQKATKRNSSFWRDCRELRELNLPK
ncbi:hypothetical protein ZWY2020_029127 [Hordeum vulgare]|nr:hypothetical protein ZWY2020_029127 [Hordeum vulgare]